MSIKKYLPTVFVLIAGIMWGLIGIFVRNLNKAGYEAMEVVCIRSIAGTILMAVFLLFFNRELFKIKLKDIWCFVGTGVVSLTFFNICYFKTIAISSLAVAAILLYTAPSMVMIMSVIIFKEKLSRRKVLSVILAFIGCVLVTGVLSDSAAISKSGIVVGLGAGLGYALYSIFARFAINKGYHSFTITFYTFVFSVVGSIPFLKPSKLISSISTNPSIIFFFLLFGLISTALPYIFYTLGLTGMESGRASIIASIEPVTATLLGIIVFHENLTVMSALGVLVVLGSIIMVNITKKN